MTGEPVRRAHRHLQMQNLFFLCSKHCTEIGHYGSFEQWRWKADYGKKTKQKHHCIISIFYFKFSHIFIESYSHIFSRDNDHIIPSCDNFIYPDFALPPEWEVNLSSTKKKNECTSMDIIMRDDKYGMCEKSFHAHFLAWSKPKLCTHLTQRGSQITWFNNLSKSTKTASQLLLWYK